jgi:kinetochore protein Spc7/SPC105
LAQQDELELLESLHMWRSTRVEPTLFEFIYHEFYRVSVPCTDYKPIPGRIDIRLWERSMLRFKDQWPQLSAYWLRVANERVARSGASSAEKALTVPEVRPTRARFSFYHADDLFLFQIVQNLSGYWSSCTRLRSQLRLLAVKFPVTMTVLPSGGFKATAKVMCPQKKARAFVSFIFDEATFASWPLSIRNVGTDVEIDYGPVE